MGIPLWPKPISVFLEIRLKDWLDDKLRCHLYHPIFDRRYPQGPLASPRLRDIYPPHWHRPLNFTFQFLCNLATIPLNPSLHLLYPLKGHPVHSRRPFVRSDKSISMTQDVTPVDLVIKKIESVPFLLLGLLV